MNEELLIMKIKPEHYQYMKTEIAKLDINAIRLSILNSDKQPKDFDKRMRWDCSYHAGLSRWISDNIYSYANDDHIDTALKSIAKELGL